MPGRTPPLNEGRSISSGDTAAPPEAGVPPHAALNEGRSISSGDTSRIISHLSLTNPPAQRRPEHKLRRHLRARARRQRGDRALNEGRSISSGDTRQVGHRRRHPPGALNEGRSISSGDTPRGTTRPPRGSCCAQRRPEHKLRRHVPATAPPSRASHPLNEGRSISSGDTR